MRDRLIRYTLWTALNLYEKPSYRSQIKSIINNNNYLYETMNILQRVRLRILKNL